MLITIVIGVLADDKRVSGIQSLDDLGEHFIKEVRHYFEMYKYLKHDDKRTIGQVNGFEGVEKAIETIDESAQRYDTEVKTFSSVRLFWLKRLR